MLYSVHTSIMSEIIPNIKEIHGYADDQAIKTSFQSGSANSERLKMNDSKTEFIFQGSQQQLGNVSKDSVKGNESSVY